MVIKATCILAAIVVCLLAALSGCGAPLFVTEAELRSLFGKEYLYAAASSGVEAFEVDVETGRITGDHGSPFGAACTAMLASTPDGRTLYAMTLLSDPIYGFRIGGDGAPASLLGLSPPADRRRLDI